jgi:hypothetical protein
MYCGRRKHQEPGVKKDWRDTKRHRSRKKIVHVFEGMDKVDAHMESKEQHTTRKREKRRKVMNWGH